eukprot:6199042-Pleurochrysis_carterae.AAC.8
MAVVKDAGYVLCYAAFASLLEQARLRSWDVPDYVHHIDFVVVQAESAKLSCANVFELYALIWSGLSERRIALRAWSDWFEGKQGLC